MTRAGQIPHLGARVLRLVTANFDRRLFGSTAICFLQLAASAAMQGEEFKCVNMEEEIYVSQKLDVRSKKCKWDLLAREASAVVTW